VSPSSDHAPAYCINRSNSKHFRLHRLKTVAATPLHSPLGEHAQAQHTSRVEASSLTARGGSGMVVVVVVVAVVVVAVVVVVEVEVVAVVHHDKTTWVW
jgi:hypothetical protein